MRRLRVSASLTILALSVLILGALPMMSGCEHTTPATEADTRVYECPMACVKPGESRPYTQRGPGDCPVCGMDLVPSAAQPSPTPTKH